MHRLTPTSPPASRPTKPVPTAFRGSVQYWWRALTAATAMWWACRSPKPQPCCANSESLSGSRTQVVNAEILMNLTPTETRVAVVEIGVVQENMIDRTNPRGLVGNIYEGKVVGVLPGMQAGFVGIGLERAAFIHAGKVGKGDSNTPIGQLLHEGQSLVVQVTKDPI